MNVHWSCLVHYILQYTGVWVRLGIIVKSFVHAGKAHGTQHTAHDTRHDANQLTFGADVADDTCVANDRARQLY